MNGSLPERRRNPLAKTGQAPDVWLKVQAAQICTNKALGRAPTDRASGIAVVAETWHMNRMPHVVKKQNSAMNTPRMLGVFRTSPNARHERLQPRGRYR
jgi:hypothetical protein